VPAALPRRRATCPAPRLEYLAIAIVGLRARRTRGTERLAWSMLSSVAARASKFDPIVVGAFTAAMANDFTAHECAMPRKGPIERALDVTN
jgi:hypothetical protein